MKYIHTILQPEESVEYVARLHWIIYAAGVILTFFISLPALLGAIASLTQETPNGARGIFLVIAALGPFLLFWKWLFRITTEMVITNKRVIVKFGLIWRKSIEMHLSKIESVDVDQSILGRLFDYGNVVVHGTGGRIENVKDIANPIEFRNRIKLN